MRKFLGEFRKEMPIAVSFIIDDITENDPNAVGLTWVRAPYSRTGTRQSF